LGNAQSGPLIVYLEPLTFNAGKQGRQLNMSFRQWFQVSAASG